MQKSSRRSLGRMPASPTLQADSGMGSSAGGGVWMGFLSTERSWAMQGGAAFPAPSSRWWWCGEGFSKRDEISALTGCGVVCA